jgi:hypothetical protein
MADFVGTSTTASLKASPSDDGASLKLLGDGASVVKTRKVLVFDTETTGLPKPSAKEKNF